MIAVERLLIQNIRDVIPHDGFRGDRPQNFVNARIAFFEIVFEIHQSQNSKISEFAMVGRDFIESLIKLFNVGGRPRLEIRVLLSLLLAEVI
jgi:hypothetical protein